MAKATLRYARLKPQKTRWVADMIRGKSIPTARQILAFSPQHSAPLILKVMESAKENAINIDPNLDEDMLFVSEVMINEGPRLKRIRARSRGMAAPVLKRTSHITVTVTERTR